MHAHTTCFILIMLYGTYFIDQQGNSEDIFANAFMRYPSSTSGCQIISTERDVTQFLLLLSAALFPCWLIIQTFCITKVVRGGRGGGPLSIVMS